jgi:hypothetical protein
MQLAGILSGYSIADLTPFMQSAKESPSGNLALALETTAQEGTFISTKHYYYYHYIEN